MRYQIIHTPYPSSDSCLKNMEVEAPNMEQAAVKALALFDSHLVGYRPFKVEGRTVAHAFGSGGYPFLKIWRSRKG